MELTEETEAVEEDNPQEELEEVMEATVLTLLEAQVIPEVPDSKPAQEQLTTAPVVALATSVVKEARTATLEVVVDPRSA